MSGLRHSEGAGTKKIFVGNLDFNTTEEKIKLLFEKHGTVENVDIASDWETGHSRGFALVEMMDVDEVERAVSALDGVRLDHRPLTVREAPPELPIGFETLGFDRLS